MKQSLRTCFLKNKFQRSLNRRAIQARKIPRVVEWIVNSEIFLILTFKETFQPAPKTGRKVFWLRLVESRTPVDKCPPEVYPRKGIFCILRHGQETAICIHKLLIGKYLKTFQPEIYFIIIEKIKFTHN